MALKGSIEPPPVRPAISVIIPARNAAGTIERAVRSGLANAGPNVEVVVVDDASSDGTAAVVEGLAVADPRVRLIRAPDHVGVSAARNLALDAAAGTWLTFLDADDRLLVGFAAVLSAAKVAGTRELSDGGGTAGPLAVVGQRTWTDGRWTWRAAAYDIDDIRRAGRTSLAARPGLVYYASATGKLFHRSLLDGLRFEGRVLGDQPWTIRALLRAGDRIEVVAADVYEWSRPRRGADSSSITALKRGSARLAAEAARVAVGALADVRAEAAVQIADPISRQRLVRTYFERLVRSDIGGPVRRAVSHRDEGTDELFQAIDALLRSAPMELVVGSPAVASEIVRPPLERWGALREPARGTYLRLLRWLLVEDPAIVERAGGRTPYRLALRRMRRSGGGEPDAFAGALLALGSPFGAASRGVRFARLAVHRLWTSRPASRAA